MLPTIVTFIFIRFVTREMFAFTISVGIRSLCCVSRRGFFGEAGDILTKAKVSGMHFCGRFHLESLPLGNRIAALLRQQHHIVSRIAAQFSVSLSPLPMPSIIPIDRKSIYCDYYCVRCRRWDGFEFRNVNMADSRQACSRCRSRPRHTGTPTHLFTPFIVLASLIHTNFVCCRIVDIRRNAIDCSHSISK